MTSPPALNRQMRIPGGIAAPFSCLPLHSTVRGPAGKSSHVHRHTRRDRKSHKPGARPNRRAPRSSAEVRRHRPESRPVPSPLARTGLAAATSPSIRTPRPATGRSRPATRRGPACTHRGRTHHLDLAPAPAFIRWPPRRPATVRRAPRSRAARDTPRCAAPPAHAGEAVLEQTTVEEPARRPACRRPHRAVPGLEPLLVDQLENVEVVGQQPIPEDRPERPFSP